MNQSQSKILQLSPSLNPKPSSRDLLGPKPTLFASGLVQPKPQTGPNPTLNPANPDPEAVNPQQPPYTLLGL